MKNRADIKSAVWKYKDELLEKLGRLVAVESVESAPLPDAPFGAGPKNALLCALDMMEKDGFATVNLDNYIGYAEMGKGEQLLGVIGHLDVVPANKEDGWYADPYTMTEKDGVLYGRGVTDDKGPVVCSMIAMKVLRDLNVPLNKRIRLIMGTNEETGSKGLAYYVAKEGDVDYGFTPDGNFPGIYGEKGFLSGVYRSKKTNILNIKGGAAKNVVCPKCTIEILSRTYSAKVLKDFFHNNSLEYEIAEGENSDVITLIGKSAHASTPELGINAISYLLIGLKEAGYQDPFVDFYVKHFGLATDGEGIGAKCSDEYGALTLNNGMIEMKDGVITGTIDCRFPVTMTGTQLLKNVQGHTEDEGGVVEELKTGEPLLYPLESPLVSALHKAYIDVTGDTVNQPMTIGGGTYAKGIGNTIAFGCEFPGRNYHIHEVNEETTVDELMLQVEIYVEALMNLLAL